MGGPSRSYQAVRSVAPSTRPSASQVLPLELEVGGKAHQLAVDGVRAERLGVEVDVEGEARRAKRDSRAAKELRVPVSAHASNAGEVIGV